MTLRRRGPRWPGSTRCSWCPGRGAEPAGRAPDVRRRRRRGGRPPDRLHVFLRRPARIRPSCWPGITGTPRARIRDAGLAFTFLRDNLYADAFLDFAGPEGVIRGPAGNGRLSAVARADVIDAAVAVLLDAAQRRGRVTPRRGQLRADRARGADAGRDRRHHHQGHRAAGALPGRNGRGSVRIPGDLWRPALAGRRVGQHLYGHRGRRARGGHR